MPNKPKTFRPPHVQTPRQRRADYDRRRAQDPATVERRKLYSSPAWKRLRDVKLSSNPLCEYCMARGRTTTPAREVDHWRPVATHPDLALEYDNLRSTCSACHSSKTAAERRGKPWRGCDLHGLPLGPRLGWNDRWGRVALTGERSKPMPSADAPMDGAVGKNGKLV